jgi:Holliday junction DNA helicase RuvA
VTELRERAGGLPSPAAAMGIAPPHAGGVEADALSALLNLGYRRPEAAAAVGRAMERLGESAGLDAVIRDSLRELAQRGPV